MTPRYVFLDQNHWIYLAKAYWGKVHKPAHEQIPAKLISQVKHDSIRLPLSVLHLIEHLRNERADRRQRLAEVFEYFSRSWFIAAWANVLSTEISRSLAQSFGCQHIPPPPEIFGRGFLFGFSTEALNQLPQDWMVADIEKIDWLATQPGMLINLLMFPNEINRLRQKKSISVLNHQSALTAGELRTIRKPYAKDVHRRAQLAGYTYQFQDQIRIALGLIGRTLDDFLALNLDELTQFWSGVPSLNVDCELTLYRDRQWSRKVEANDFTDIGHLALAVPYCDIVVVERFWARAIQETGLANKYQVAVCTDLEELSELLN